MSDAVENPKAAFGPWYDIQSVVVVGSNCNPNIVMFKTGVPTESPIVIATSISSVAANVEVFEVSSFIPVCEEV